MIHGTRPSTKQSTGGDIFMKKFITLGLFFLLIIIFAACKNDDIVTPDYLPCPDGRFIGKWVYDGTITNSHVQGRHAMYNFLDNNRIKILYKSVLPSAVDYFPKSLEWKKDGDLYYSRDWNVSSSWQIFDIIYVDDNSIIIEGKTFTKTTNWYPDYP
jgi:hypothetical protein